MEQRHIIIVSVLAIVIIGLNMLFVWPAYQAWDSGRRTLRGTVKLLNDTNKTQETIQPLLKTKALIESKAALAMAMIPVQQDREGFITQLDELARANSLSLGAFTFSDSTTQSSAAAKKSKSGAKVTSYTASITGNYQNLHTFVAKLPGLSRFTQLSTMNITVSESGVTAQITGTIYNKEQPKIPAALSITPTTWQYIDTYRAGESFDTIPSQGRSNPFNVY